MTATLITGAAVLIAIAATINARRANRALRRERLHRIQSLGADATRTGRAHG